MVRHSVSTEGTEVIWNTGQKCVMFPYPRSTLNKTVYGVRTDQCHLMRHMCKLGYVYDCVVDSEMATHLFSYQVPHRADVL